MNGTPSRESLIVLCPIFRVDLNLNRAQDGASAKSGATVIENVGPGCVGERDHVIEKGRLQKVLPHARERSCTYGHHVLTLEPNS
jgi:hypothetical protein